jgi:iron complex outermembrane receptor protein
VDSFEAGYRASLFDHRVQFTSAVFYNKYKGIQIARAGNAANAAISNAIIDAGTARTYGAEASLTWQVTPELSISGNIGYLNAKYLNARYPGSPIVDPFDASGKVMSLAPKWQGGASVNLDQPVGPDLKVKANALVSFISRYNYQYEENPFLWQNAYQVVNVRVGVGDRDDHVTGYLFVNNLFDADYTIFGTNNSLGSLLTPAPPRVIGGTMEVKF